ncbi:MAG: PIG-L family deacetylase [Planctomycetia bacterium]|nr:PIG-L family deacetylase [Planctomycetia bacterium]
MAKTILGIGAHYDDCVFGISGTLLKAVRKNYRVVILSLIGDYSNWKPVAGRDRELVPASIELAKQHGVEMRFLDFASMRYEVTDANKRVVAQAVAEIGADVAFLLWPHDSHTDHEVASELAKTALRHGDRLLPAGTIFKAPRRIYQYDNGPRHTIGFEPDTFVDITDEWPQASEWLGRLMAIVRNEKYDAARPDAAQRAKETLAAYRGATSGVRYAEAFRAANAYVQEIF